MTVFAPLMNVPSLLTVSANIILFVFTPFFDAENKLLLSASLTNTLPVLPLPPASKLTPLNVPEVIMSAVTAPSN